MTTPALDAATAELTGPATLLVGLGVTGAAVAAALRRRGVAVTVVDDRPSGSVRARARQLGLELVVAPTPDQLSELLAAVSSFVPAPGLPFGHEAFARAAALGVPVLSELDLAAVWDRRPCVAITGTDGKTTVTTLVTAMLCASGVRAVDAGNTETPLVAAIDDPDVDVFVVEASSFRLAAVSRFRPRVGTWLNFAADHLDAHADLAAYEAAKARIWSNAAGDDLAVANLEDPVVMRHVPSGARVETFGLSSGLWRCVEGRLCTPDGTILAHTSELFRALPHDVMNVLAAAATATGAGATLEGVRRAAVGFAGLPHRVSLVGERDGVRWYDDSKATAPHATLSAVRGFSSVVLIAGGRNKGLDLTALRAGTDRLRAVVALGEAAPELAAAFEGLRPVETVASMQEAVRRAGELARPGDAVLLSPACASFDQYSSYAERGEDFSRLVSSHLERT